MGYHGWCWIVKGISFVAGMLNEKDMLLCLTGVVVLLIALVVSGVKIRCPECKKRIPERMNMRIEVCPYCGKRL